MKITFRHWGGDIIPHKQCQEINWDAKAISNNDPHTLESELQVQKLINLQHIANNTPDAFTDYKGVTNPIILQEMRLQE
jgi:hypothetical protein